MTPNIEKHAAALLYPLNFKHPHPQFSGCDRLIIEQIKDPHLKKLFNKNLGHYIDINGVLYEQNPFDFIRVEDILCKCDDKLLYEQIFGVPGVADDVMAYKSCRHTIFAAAKRQMKMAPTPEPKVADDFLEYAKSIIEKEVGEDLTHFSYSYQQWYNHLDKTKQHDMDDVSKYIHGEFELLDPQLIEKIKRNRYEGICKVELQDIDGKPRMVCSIPPYTKYVMGPITWQLEELFSRKFKGYCGGKNLSQMAEMVNKYAAMGFTNVIEGDGSAFDNTQDITLKRVDHYIYQRIKHAVYHVDKDEFIRVATEPYKTMDVLVHDNYTKKKVLLFTYSILGSVFSGDCDTTLMNTIRMALYNRYVNDKAGLVFGKDYICYSKGDDFTVQYKPYIKKEQIDKIYYDYFVPSIKDVSKPDTRIYGLGQVLKMLDQGGLDSIKFCSLRAWYKNAHEIILTRDPKKFYTLSKYSRKIKTYNSYQAYKFLMQQAEALEASYKGIWIFDTMAECYKLKAKQFLLDLGHNAAKYENMYNRQMARKQKRLDNVRNKISPFEMKESDFERLLYNIKYRETFYRIQGDYWETMQALERINVDIYTQEELDYINDQISKEFDVEELKSALGLKNNEFEKK